MIFIDPNSIPIPPQRRAALKALTNTLLGLPQSERASFIDAHREESWAHPEVLTALISAVGNKCWYSEVHLEGADPNVDHFRPKGRVREVDSDLKSTGKKRPGYWWLAFEPENYRLTCIHANQRRTDPGTSGGKWDYFPIVGKRTPSRTAIAQINEEVLVLDPCKLNEVRMLCFDTDGRPCAADTPGRRVDDKILARVKATIWLYHLDKNPLQQRRFGYVDEIKTDLKRADTYYRLWAPDSENPNTPMKIPFEDMIAEIKSKVESGAVFSGAKQCAVRAAVVSYPWVESYLLR